jgi:hypothetical protein
MPPDDSQSHNTPKIKGQTSESSRSLRARRTNPALPGATMPAAPVAPILPVASVSPSTPALPATPQRRRQHSQRSQQPVRRAAWKLLALGIAFALACLLLYPLFAASTGAKSAYALLIVRFPWIPHLYWTAWPPAVRAISRLPVFNLSQPGGSANLLLLGMALASGLYLVAARVASNAGREVEHGRPAPREARLLFWIIFVLTVLFALLFLFIPAVMTQDVFLYGLYGRMVSVYHVNPYIAPVTVPPGDILHGVLAGQVGHPAFGPVWLDAALAGALIARDSAANILFDFRLLALGVHLLNALLVWNVLARLRPAARFTGTLLYAWNPAVLLLGIAEMHLDLVVILFILLAALFFQRGALILSWVCLLLAALIQPLTLLLLPLFLRLYAKVLRAHPAGRRAGWWLLLIATSLLIVTLAYAPYYAGWSLSGIAAQLRLAFVPATVLNSLAASIQHLRFSNSPAIIWLAAPLTWTILAALVVSCLLLLGIWLADTLEFTLLFAAWIFLAVLVISPSYLAWYTLLPLALAICSAHPRTTLLALLLALGALLSYYFNLSASPWEGQGLVTIGLPVLIWGWSLFFASTWRMSRANAGLNTQTSGQLPAVRPRGPRFSHPSWLGRRGI